MNAIELKSEVASYRLKLRNKPAKLVASDPNGPVDMDLIDILVNAISSLERRIDGINLTTRPKAIKSTKTTTTIHRATSPVFLMSET